MISASGENEVFSQYMYGSNPKQYLIMFVCANKAKPDTGEDKHTCSENRENE